MSCCCKHCRCCACVGLVALIPGMFEVDAVGLEVSCDTAVVACLLVVPGGIYFPVVCVVFCGFSLFACFRGMIVHCALWTTVLLPCVSSSGCSSVTSSAMATISTTDV